MILVNNSRAFITDQIKKVTAVALTLCFLLNTGALAGLDGNKAAYQGGSTKDKDFPGTKAVVEGNLITGEDSLKFEYKLNKEDKVYSIPYDKIADLEYGQKAGRRIGVAAATAILINPIGLVALFSKKRRHYITIGYKDSEGKDQVSIFEMGKDITRVTLSILETKSGKKIEYQDEESKKSSRG